MHIGVSTDSVAIATLCDFLLRRKANHPNPSDLTQSPADLVQTHGADSLIGQLATTMNGSTDTTFYVLAVYFGSVGITRIRHAVPAGLAADITGALAAVAAVHLLLAPTYRSKLDLPPEPVTEEAGAGDPEAPEGDSAPAAEIDAAAPPAVEPELHSPPAEPADRPTPRPPD